jgi:hypothetical protein
MISARLFALAASFLLLAHIYLMLESLSQARRAVDTLDKMRKLAAIAAHNFPDQAELSDEAFWKYLNRANDPMNDAWGGKLSLEAREGQGGREFFWRSAGPDRVRSTGDDLERKVVWADRAYPPKDEPSATDAR